MRLVPSLPFLTLFVYLSLLLTSQCLSQTITGQASNNTELLNSFEEHLFFRQYCNQDEKARLARIEMQIFGEQYDDSIESRILRIKNAWPSIADKNNQNSKPKSKSNNDSKLKSENSDQAEDLEQQKFKVIEARTQEVNSLLSEAIACYRQKDLNRAIGLFSQVIRLDPQNASAHFSLAVALQANGDLAQAANNYQQALDIEPNNKDYQLAVRTIKNKLAQEGIAKFNKHKYQLLATQASESFKNGQYEQSLSLYKELDKQQPKQALHKYNIGTIYLFLKKPEEALPYYKEAHKLEPTNAHYEESLQKLELATKQAKEDKQAEQKTAAKSKKQSAVAYFGLTVKSNKNGLVIKNIVVNSRAAQVGLQPGDIIQLIDGLRLNKVQQLEQMLRSKPIGQRFQILVIRKGQRGEILF